MGNLGDISARARETLARVDILAAEDTRVARRLLGALGIKAPRLARYDDAKEGETSLLAAIRAGKAVGLIADAGSPLIADPGYRLVAAARDAGVKVAVVPGPSAAIAALMLAGLPTDRFLFAGFLPRGSAARRAGLAEIAGVRASLVFYEAPHRLAETLADMAATLGPRRAAVVREITKLFEETRVGRLDELAAAFAGDTKGEIVIVVGPPEAQEVIDIDTPLKDALKRLSVRDAVAQVAATTGVSRAVVYARALELKQ